MKDERCWQQCSWANDLIKLAIHGGHGRINLTNPENGGSKVRDGGTELWPTCGRIVDTIVAHETPEHDNISDECMNPSCVAHEYDVFGSLSFEVDVQGQQPCHDISMHPNILFGDVLAASARLKAGKSIGSDGLISEIVKSLDLECCYRFYTCFALLVSGYPIPVSWKYSRATTLPKESCPCSLEKFRSVILDAMKLKWYWNLLHVIMDGYFVGKHWTFLQCGGVTGRQAVDIIFSINFLD